VEWLAGDREPVRKGQPVCLIETSKSAIEIESPGDGTLCHLARAGEDVDLGSRIAVVATTDAELTEVDGLRESAAAKPTPGEQGKATRKAIELAEEHGIDLATITKAGFITAEDVEALVAGQQAGTDAGRLPGPAVLGGVSVERVSLPESLTLDETAGALDPKFLTSLRTDPDAFRALPASERCDLYRRHGAQIGEDVQLGERTLIVSPRIVLGDGVEIGDDGTVQCDEVFCAGALTNFRARLRLRCRRAFIGAGGYFGEDVHIGGGGAGDPQALLVIGDLAFVGAEAFINPCRPIVVGREVFVTMRSVLVTHNVGHSLLEGFENRFAPIVLEDRCQVGIGVVVYAGCRIGADSIVGSNSYVVSDIPPGKLAIGVPARVAGSSVRTLSPARRLELAEGMMAELHELLVLRGHDVDAIADRPSEGIAVTFDGRTSHVLFRERLDGAFAPPESDGETIVLTFELEGDPPDGCGVLELVSRRFHGPGGVVLDSVREFCRKRGIRFEPGPWRYRGGLI